MSVENTLTLNVYEKYAASYIENSIKKEREDPIVAHNRETELQGFLKHAFATVDIGSRILEIGSGGGENAKFLSDIGYCVTASDAANSFVVAMQKNGINAIRFNVLEDVFRCSYKGILCWRVFVHFTIDDAKIVLSKSYKALENGGVFVFNAMNKDEYNTDNEWIDFSGTYHLGEKRFYQYYDRQVLESIVSDVGFKVLDAFQEGGSNNKKWLVYVLQK